MVLIIFFQMINLDQIFMMELEARPDWLWIKRQKDGNSPM